MRPVTTNHYTQRSRLLQLLIEARGAEVPLPQILDLRISQFGARIHELRKLGFKITNRTERIAGVVHSYFRLELGEQPTLFGDISPARRYPD
jgi:hypothetical protein